jgi:hypothetical protein
MSEHTRYPSIDQFRNVIKRVTDLTRYNGSDEEGKATFNNLPLPKITFNGTVKLHGTNAAIRYDVAERKVTFQSRERDLSLDSDNAGFCLWGSQSAQRWANILEDLSVHGDVTLIVYGEWCGGNIQSGVALSQLPKMFVIFGAKAINAEGEEEWWAVHYLKDHILPDDVFFIRDYPAFDIEIDFENPHLAQNQIVEWVAAVEAECPVGKEFGVSGIGEGIVFSAMYKGHYLQFKSKGEKHSNSKVTKTASVDIDKINTIKEFVASVVSEPRLKQGLDYFREMGIEPIDKNVGQYIQWVNRDIMKEEMDTIVENQLDPKMIAKEASNVSRRWYFDQI